MLREARQGSAAASKAAAETADEETALKRFEAQRRLQPRSPADFALLQQELAAWHRAETARIKAAELSPEERHLAFCHLLHQVSCPIHVAKLPCPCVWCHASCTQSASPSMWLGQACLTALPLCLWPHLLHVSTPGWLVFKGAT